MKKVFPFLCNNAPWQAIIWNSCFASFWSCSVFKYYGNLVMCGRMVGAKTRIIWGHGWGMLRASKVGARFGLGAWSEHGFINSNQQYFIIWIIISHDMDATLHKKCPNIAQTMPRSPTMPHFAQHVTGISVFCALTVHQPCPKLAPSN